MKKQKDKKSIFNIVYFLIVFVIFSVGLVIETAGISSASTASGALSFYEHFEDSLELYENLDYSNQFLIPKYSRYEAVKKNILESIKMAKEDGRDTYISRMYDKHGETVLKAYYFAFVMPMYSSMFYSLECIIVFVVVLLIIKLVYKYFSYIPTLVVSLILFFGPLLFAESAFVGVLIAPLATIIAFVNVVINFFVFDKKKTKKKVKA